MLLFEATTLQSLRKNSFRFNKVEIGFPMFYYALKSFSSSKQLKTNSKSDFVGSRPKLTLSLKKVSVSDRWIEFRVTKMKSNAFGVRGWKLRWGGTARQSRGSTWTVVA